MAFSASLSTADLAAFAGRLMSHLVPDGTGHAVTTAQVDTALQRIERCFSAIHRKYYAEDDRVAFDHLNGDHLATFLYLLANTVHTGGGDPAVATKLFSVNKTLHGLDLFYSVRMPEVFLLVHPVGTVIGNAEYADELVVYQNCTIGSQDGVYPRFGTGVVLYSRTSVLGGTVVGDDVVFAANSFVIGAEIPAHSIVVGQHPSHRVLPNPHPVHDRIFAPPAR
jgi:serine O-acetyltransferase